MTKPLTHPAYGVLRPVTETASVLLADKDVMGVLDQKTVDDAFDLKVQLKNVDHIFDRVFRTPVAAGVS